MRIQHNIMAMSAYRNYNTNTSALAKNLEKLSSGYKINRAGDDAAGLAISEKMRAQITGLNAASKNVKDGISLVKTAEGAMQEIQDMLNRMDYLATQSANGTYQDAVDRENLNKEMENLKTEINRIADSANFNGIKLLDGSLQEGYSAKTEAQLAADQAQAAADAALAAAPNAKGEIKFGAEITLDLPDQAANNTPSANRASETILETDKAPDGEKPGFSITFNGMSHTFVDPTKTTTNDANPTATPPTTQDYVKITIEGPTGKSTDIKLSEKNIADAYKEITGEEAKKGSTANAEVIAKAVENLITKTGVANTADGGTVTPGEFSINGGKDKFTVRADGDRAVFEVKGTPTDDQKVPNYTVKVTGVPVGEQAATQHSYKTGDYTKATAGTGTGKFTIEAELADGKKVTFESAAKNNTTTAANWVDGLKDAEATIDGKTVKLSEMFTVTNITGNNYFTIKSKTAGVEQPKVTGVTYSTSETTAANKATLAEGKLTEGVDAYTGGTSGYSNSGSPVTIQVGSGAIDQLASTNLTLDETQVVDGATLRLGDQKYIFAIGEDSAYKDLEGAVYVDVLKETDDYTKATDGTITLTDKGLEKMLTKLAEVAKDNKTFSVSHTASATGAPGLIGLKQLQEVKDTTEMKTMDQLKSYIGLTSVDKDATAASDADAVKAAEAEAAKLQAKADELKKAAEDAVDGKPLNLQIGDTSDSFNQMKVSIGNMHVSAMKLEGEDGTSTSIADIDILTSENAQSAVDVIKNAINYVSSVRGDLGAYQNRLEHTANNLSVMAENIQDAESTIRDTDIAEEMMSYTKNNILVQSAQAMLAQANAVPQGVLQLLG